MALNVVRFATNQAGVALFPDVFFFSDSASGSAPRFRFEDKDYQLVGIYSMHTELDKIATGFQTARLEEWPALEGKEVSFDEWLQALAKGHAFKHDFPEEIVQLVVQSRTLENAITLVWSCGNPEVAQRLTEIQSRWIELGEFKRKLGVEK